MPTKEEKEREARIAARKLEATKKRDERDAKAKALQTRLGKSMEKTKACRAAMLKGGVIIDVINVVQARLAQEAGFKAVCALEMLPATMANNKMPRMCDPRVTRSIANSVLIPVVAKITIGHEIEAEVAVSTGANFIDEFEFASATTCYIEDKKYLPVPVICGVVTLVDCIRRLKEGASILRTRQTMAVRADATLIAINKIADELAALQVTLKDEAKKVTWLTTNSLEAADVEFLKDAKDISVLPLYAYGGISTPRDVALMMEMKCTGVFVDNSIFTSDIPRKRLGAMVKAVECFDNMDEMIKLSTGTAERY